MDCLENAGRLPASEYAKATIYSTLSPCAMCTGAILLYGIPRVVVGENRTFQGPQDLFEASGVDVTVVDDGRCVDLMQRFIAANPSLWDEDIGE
jgi:cytosine deaminase